MTDETVRIVYNGTDYTWDGESWYETRSFATPPTVIIGQLHKALAEQTKRSEANNSEAA